MWAADTTMLTASDQLEEGDNANHVFHVQQTKQYWYWILQRIVSTASFPQRPNEHTIREISNALHVPLEHENIIANPTIASYVAILRKYDEFISRSGRDRISAESIRAHLEEELGRGKARTTLSNKQKRLTEFILRANGIAERVTFRIRPADRQQLNKFDNRGFKACDAFALLQRAAEACQTLGIVVAGEKQNTAQVRFIIAYLCLGAGLRTLEARRLTVTQIKLLARGNVVKIQSSKKKSGLRENVKILPFLLTTDNSRHHISVMPYISRTSVSDRTENLVPVLNETRQRNPQFSLGDIVIRQLYNLTVVHLKSALASSTVELNLNFPEEGHLDNLLLSGANISHWPPLLTISANGLAKSFKALMRTTLGRSESDGAGVRRNPTTLTLEPSSRGLSFRGLRKSFMKIMAFYLHSQHLDPISTMQALKTYSRHETENQLRIYLQNEDNEENLENLLEWFDYD